jgi:hypothetical protein
MLTGRPVKICAQPRGGLLLPPRPPPGADALQDRREEQDGTHHRVDFQTLPRRRRLRQLRRREHVLHGRAADGDLPVPRTTTSAARASSRTSRRAGPSAVTARRSRASASRCSSTRSRCALGLDPADLRLEQPGAARVAHRQLPAHRDDGPRSASRRSSTARAGSERRGKLEVPDGRSASACSSATCAAPACRSTGTACRTRACSSSSIARASSPRSAAAPTSARAATDVLGWIVGEVLGIDPLGIKVVTGDTDLTPVDLGSYSSRVTLMMGNAAMQAAERARDLIARASREARRAAGRLVFAELARVRRRGPEVGMPFQDAVIAHRGELRHARHRRQLHAAAVAAKFRGGGVGPSPSYSLLGASSRSRSIRRPASIGCRRSGWRTTSAARSTPRWRWGRSRAASTWASARR